MIIINMIMSNVCAPEYLSPYEWREETNVLGIENYSYSLVFHDFVANVFTTWIPITQAAMDRARIVTAHATGCKRNAPEKLLKSLFDKSKQCMKREMTVEHLNIYGEI